MEQYIDGAKLRDFIESRGMTLASFAREAKVGYGWLHDIVSGRSAGNITMSNMTKMAEVGGVTLGQFLAQVAKQEIESDPDLAEVVAGWDRLDNVERRLMSERMRTFLEQKREEK